MNSVKSEFNNYKYDKKWDIANKVLYDLCKKYHNHNKVEEIVPKLWLIGRSYSASIERRKINLDINSDKFYLKVSKNIIKFNKKKYFDKKLDIIGADLNEDSLKKILELHSDLVKVLKKMTGKNNRSFVSKYLHFHNDIIPIYDSIANKSLSKIISNHKKEFKKFKKEINLNLGDKVYSSFCVKFLFLYNLIETENPTTREIDTYLLYLGSI